MRSVKYLVAAAGAASLFSSAALAADMPSIMPPPAQQYYAPPVQDFGGWYLRGDIGVTSTSSNTLISSLDPSPAIANTQRFGSFNGGTSYGVGVGYQFNNWFRADITGEYRSKVNFNGNNFYQYFAGAPNNNLGDTYAGGYSSWVGLVNAYVDLGTWWCLTPFVGAGVGGAYNVTSGMSDSATFPGGAGASLYQADGASKLNLAWAAYAGVAYKVTNNFTIELAYRYLDMGNAGFGQGHFFDGANGGPSTFSFNHDLTSQDIRLGVRWTCCDVPPPPPPLIRKG
jgi:opacity protein-like surface antigen